MLSLPAFLQISSVTYAEPGRWAKSRWESAEEHRGRCYQLHRPGDAVPMADLVTHSSKRQVLGESDTLFVVSSFINVVADATLSA